MGWLQAAGLALGFLTRIPVPTGSELAPRALGRALGFFPLIGALLGLALVAADLVLQPRLSVELRAVLLVMLLAALNGALHLDGLADLCDGLGGGRGDRVRALAIMRDSRIGSYGACALVLLLLAKVIALRDVLLLSDPRLLCTAPLIARAAAVPLVVWFPYARPEGLGHAFHAQGRALDCAFAGCLAVASLWMPDARMLVGATVALVVALGLGSYVQRKLRGLTGDVYGAAIELAELSFWVGALLA